MEKIKKVLNVKPNKEQAIYMAVILQGIAFGVFAMFGVPAFVCIVAHKNVGENLLTLGAAAIGFAAFSLKGYHQLDESQYRKVD